MRSRKPPMRLMHEVLEDRTRKITQPKYATRSEVYESIILTVAWLFWIGAILVLAIVLLTHYSQDI